MFRRGVIAVLRRMRSPRSRRAALALALIASGLFVVRAVARPAPLLAHVPGSRAVWDAEGRLLRITLASDEQYRLITPLGAISPQLVEATLLHEDRWFRWHPGVNPVALLRATVTTLSGDRRVGGSTITMQVARRLHHLPTRTVRGKLLQIARALQIELLHSKDEILEAYLNLVPCGNNVEGFGAAALIDFGRPASTLALPEALALAVIPQSPLRRAPRPENAALQQARMTLFRRWLKRHPGARADEPVIQLPLAVRGLDELPFGAPHYAESVLAENPGASDLRGTLDPAAQRIVERHLRGYVARERRNGIRNAAALLVDHRTMAVKALVGSADYGDVSISGQVNGAAAKRSPGSALKPFVYALGFDQGVIHPRTMLKDTPTAFAAWTPENFDGRFVGPISARDALVRSRNIPALAVAAKLSRPSFYQLLESAGIARMQSEDHYGLSPVLGGLEVTMEELVGLYAMLANHGLHRPLRKLQSEPQRPGVRLISDEAAFLTLDILRGNPRPDRFAEVDQGSAPPVYWKTGTSFGFRDAWAVGIFGPYVMAVWVGEFGGAGSPAFVGIQAAAPLFFEIADALRARSPEGPRAFAWRPAVPGHLTRVEVCAVSGELPGPHCHHRTRTWFIPGTSPIDVCRIHREVLIDDATGMRACAQSGGGTRNEVMEVWPSDMLRLFALAGMPRREPPRLDPRCGDDGRSRGAPPTITSPLRGVTYTVDPTAPDRNQLPLTAVSDGDAREIYWFIDERYAGKARRGHPLLYAPAPGLHVVRAVDDLGRSDVRDLRVDTLPR